MMTIILLILIGGAVLLMLKYNSAQGLAQGVKKSHSDITIALKKRVDLVNKLIDIAKSYGEHEKLTIISIVEGDSLSNLAQAAMKADATITQLNTIARNYPDLKANQTYLRLMDDLTIIETEIQAKRERFNNSVMEYNTFCNSIPFVFFAPTLGFPQASYFDVSNADSLESIKDFVTDDGALLRQKFANAGTAIANSTKEFTNKLEENGKTLLDKTKVDIEGIDNPRNNAD